MGMLKFNSATHCSNIKKSTVFGNYLDPLSILEHFKLTCMEVSIICESRFKSLGGFPLPGYSRLVDIPLGSLVSKSEEKVELSTFVYWNLMCSVDKAHAVAASGLSDVIPYVNQYFESVRSNSFYPEILDLYNIWSGLCSWRPEVVVEIGGGVSTSLISFYCSNYNAKHILIDPEEYWVQNTLNGLEACGLRPPVYQPLPVMQKEANMVVGVDFAKLNFNQNTYNDFDYSNSLFLNNISGASKKLFFVDANCKNSCFQGAELFVDPVVSQMLSVR